MYEVSLDAWYAWLGVVAASFAVAGVVIGLPTAAPPDAVTLADTVDEIAASEHEAAATIPLEVTEYRVNPHRLSLRSDAGTTHATLAFGPVTPVGDNPLRAVLEGADPADVFRTEAAYRQAIEHAQADETDWQSAPEQLAVKRVVWGDVDATLVG